MREQNPVLGARRPQSSEPPGGALAVPAALGALVPGGGRTLVRHVPMEPGGSRRLRWGERGGTGGTRREGAEGVLWGTGGHPRYGRACAVGDLGGTGGNHR